MVDEIYVSTDVEADGPIPGPNTWCKGKGRTTLTQDGAAITPARLARLSFLSFGGGSHMDGASSARCARRGSARADVVS
jgi:hypothetical protein